MKIALHDSDATSYPNLALMKLSAWHKERGDSVSWYAPLFPADKIYSSKVFTFTEENKYLPDKTTRGGFGYNLTELPDEIEHVCPDYTLYSLLDYSLGFLTRGCNKKCEHCFVPEKEGSIREHADIDEFLRHRNVVLMDNNILAHSHGIKQIEKMTKLDIKVDFNQGIEARLIDDNIARLLSKLNWLSPLRLACDNQKQIKHVARAVELLRWHNVSPRRYFCYCLVENIDEAVDRVRFLKGLNVDPFAQPYMDKAGTEPSKEQRHFARWVNHKAEFKSCIWDEYKKRVQ